MTMSLLAGAAEPDIFARVVGGAAACIALLSLFVSWRSYRRGGVKVKVTTEKIERDYGLYAGAPSRPETMISVTATNLRTGRVQITKLIYEVKGEQQARVLEGLRPPVPHVLEGLHTANWEFYVATIADQIGLKDAAEIRMDVILATSKKRTGPWFTITLPETKNL